MATEQQKAISAMANKINSLKGYIKSQENTRWVDEHLDLTDLHKQLKLLEYQFHQMRKQQ